MSSGGSSGEAGASGGDADGREAVHVRAQGVGDLCTFPPTLLKT